MTVQETVVNEDGGADVLTLGLDPLRGGQVALLTGRDGVSMCMDIAQNASLYRIGIACADCRVSCGFSMTHSANRPMSAKAKVCDAAGLLMHHAMEWLGCTHRSASEYGTALSDVFAPWDNGPKKMVDGWFTSIVPVKEAA